jgi:hypothetical protein
LCHDIAGEAENETVLDLHVERWRCLWGGG